VKLCVWVFFEIVSRKFKFHWNLRRITALHMKICPYLL